MLIHCIAFTAPGAELCVDLERKLGENCYGYAPDRYCKANKLTPLSGSAGEWAAQRFNVGEALVFVGAAGIAVRSIAPLVASKAKDPAVLCIDEGGGYVIPLLSGHIGGANELARQLAVLLGATAVLTTATDVRGVFAVDSWAVAAGCHITDTSHIKAVSAALLDGRQVGLQSDFPIDGTLPQGVVQDGDLSTGILLSLSESCPFAHTLHLIPRCLRVGIGCRKDTDAGSLEAFLLRVLAEHDLPVEAVESIATVTLKQYEPALVKLCERYRLPLNVYAPEELAQIHGTFTASDFVKEVTGVDNVCERAAVSGGGTLIIGKTAHEGMTIAVAKRNWQAKF